MLTRILEARSHLKKPNFGHQTDFPTSEKTNRPCNHCKRIAVSRHLRFNSPSFMKSVWRTPTESKTCTLCSLVSKIRAEARVQIQGEERFNHPFLCEDRLPAGRAPAPGFVVKAAEDNAGRHFVVEFEEPHGPSKYGLREDWNDTRNVHLSFLLRPTQDHVKDSKNMGDVVPPLRPYREGVVYRPDASTPQINFDKIIELLHECSNDHEQCTRMWQGPRYSHVVSTLFIDVEGAMLVEGNTSWRYVALSYAWGQVSMLKTTKQNVETLKKPGGLSSALSEVPRTIRDAMTLTSRLKERFLWVDCLCIVQDDAERKHDAIQKMDIIYSQAYVAVVAADGHDAQAGLSGVQAVDRNLPNSPDLILHGFKLGLCSPVVQSFESSQARCYLNERAWTLQEMSLSRRALYIFRQQAFVVCLKNVRGETRELDDKFTVSSHMFALFQTLFTQVARPCTSEQDHDQFMSICHFPAAYRSIISTYTAASLSFPQDTLNAFAGLAAVLSEGFHRQVGNGIFLYGMPERWIWFALLFEPIDRITRRRDLASGQKLFPSWTWAGWTGQISRSYDHNLELQNQHLLNVSSRKHGGAESSSEHKSEFQKFREMHEGDSSASFPRFLELPDHRQLRCSRSTTLVDKHAREFAIKRDYRPAEYFPNRPNPAVLLLGAKVVIATHLAALFGPRQKPSIYDKETSWLTIDDPADRSTSPANILVIQILETEDYSAVLLLRSDGDFWERIGSGRVHLLKWPKAHEVYKRLEII